MLTWISLVPQEPHEGTALYVSPGSQIQVRAEQLTVSCDEPVEVIYLRTPQGACHLFPSGATPWRDVSDVRLRAARRARSHTFQVRPHHPLAPGDSYFLALSGPKTARVQLGLRTLESTLPRPAAPKSGDPELRSLFLWDAGGSRRTLWV